MDIRKKSSSVLRYAIGDVHGRPFWRSYINGKYSEFYFIGDYFDSPDISFAKQYVNFEAICSTARTNRRVKLCLGNHDYQYLRGVHGQRYSGFQEQHCKEISDILEDNIDLLKIVYVTKDNYILSHAGITSCFLSSIGGAAPEDINSAFAKNRNILNFNGENVYGDDITQSPLWVRPGSLQDDPLPGYNQIVGHTPVEKIIEIQLRDENKLALIDTGDIKTIYRF